MNEMISSPNDLGKNWNPVDSTSTVDVNEEPAALAKRLAAHCAAYRFPDTRRSLAQLAITLSLFITATGLMYLAAGHAYWIALLLSIPAGGLLVKLFIIQHDCGHGSYFKNRTANQTVGRILSLLTLTPYGFWRRAHSLHHATSGNLDRRGIGDIDTLTIKEYLALPLLSRLRYRLYRNPFILFLIGMPTYFLILHRIPFGMPLPFQEVWKSVLTLDIAIAVVYGGITYLIGWQTALMILVPIICVASWIGGWLFYIQHQFEETHWEEAKNWDIFTAAIKGSSYYDLHPVLQWFTGSIGLHHIHHLNSRIPNYRLQECLDDSPELLRLSRRITFFQSLKYINLTLWDEDQKKLVSFGQLAKLNHA